MHLKVHKREVLMSDQMVDRGNACSRRQQGQHSSVMEVALYRAELLRFYSFSNFIGETPQVIPFWRNHQTRHSPAAPEKRVLMVGELQKERVDSGPGNLFIEARHLRKKNNNELRQWTSREPLNLCTLLELFIFLKRKPFAIRLPKGRILVIVSQLVSCSSFSFFFLLGSLADSAMDSIWRTWPCPPVFFSIHGLQSLNSTPRLTAITKARHLLTQWKFKNLSTLNTKSLLLWPHQLLPVISKKRAVRSLILHQRPLSLSFSAPRRTRLFRKQSCDFSVQLSPR